MSETAVVSSGYSRARCPAGGSGGSFHYEDNIGYLDYQFVQGDFDVIADIQCMNYGETDLPPDNGDAHAYGLACHNLVTPEYTAGFVGRSYYHRVITNAPTGRDSSARMVSEWKYTVSSVTTWNTFDGQELRDAAALGGSFDDLGGRWWVRIRRIGDVFTSWDAPLQADGSVPSALDWVNEHEQTVSIISEFALVGLVVYSSSGDGSVTGRCRAILNFNPQG